MKKNILMSKLNTLLPWLTLAAITLLLYMGINFNNKINVLIVLGILSMTHGFLYFVKHGGNYITPTGLYLLTSALLVGFASVYLAITKRYDFGSELFYATFIGFIAQLVIYSFSANFTEIPRRTNKMSAINILTLKNVKILGYTSLLIGLVGSLLEHNYTMFTNAFMYLGVLIIVISIWNEVNNLKSISRIVFTIMLFILYYILVFDNFGRIVLATLVLSIAIGINHLFKKVNIKYVIILFLGPILLIASTIRKLYIIDINPDFDPSSTSGFGSIVSPLYTFGRLLLLYSNNMIDLKLGKTIWSALIVLFPRAWWVDKPQSFGREITLIFRPDLVSVGHSEASIIYGEWLFNFGYIGLIISLVFFVVVLRILDKSYRKVILNRLNSVFGFLQYIIFIILVSGIINLFWGGFSTFMTRDGFRIIIIFMIYLIFLLIPKKNTEAIN